MFIINPYIFKQNYKIFSLHTSLTAGGATLTIPSTVIYGDLLLIFDKAINSTGEPTTVIPSGFTQISYGFNDVRKHIISYKIADNSDANRIVSTLDGTATEGSGLFVFRPSSPISSIEILGLNEVQTDGDPSSQTLNISSEINPLIVIGAFGQQTSTSATFTPTQDGELSILTSNRFRYKIYNTSPSNVTVDEGDGGLSNYLASFYIKGIWQWYNERGLKWQL